MHKADQRLAREISRRHLRKRQAGHDVEVHGEGRRKAEKSQRNQPKLDISLRSTTPRKPRSPSCSRLRTAKTTSFICVGKKGIAPGEHDTGLGREDGDERLCEWFIKAVFSDGNEAPSPKFRFLREDDLELEF